MLWAPPPKYTSQSVRSACGRDAEQQELRRKASETNLHTSSSVRQLQTVLSTSGRSQRPAGSEGLTSQTNLHSSNSVRQLQTVLATSGRSRRPAGGEGLLSQRLFNNAHIRCESPPRNAERSHPSAGDSKGQAASDTRPTKPANQQSMSRLPISAALQRQASCEALPFSGGRSTSRGAASSRSLSRQDRPMSPSSASVVSSAAPTARESNTPRIQIRSCCPDLDIAPKDVAAMTKWYSDFEGPLSSAFPDARCPYAWLDPATQGPDVEVLDAFEKPWSFSDFRQEWDYADLSQFSAWCQERTGPSAEKASGSKENCQVLKTRHTEKAVNDSASRQSPLQSLPTPSRAVPVRQLQQGDPAYAGWPQGKEPLAAIPIADYSKPWVALAQCHAEIGYYR